MARGDLLCAEIAEKQLGLITRAQAVRAGISERAISRRLTARRWYQVLPGVYRLAGVPNCWEQSLKAATLWGGDGCVVSHRAAAALHGLSGFHGREIEVQSSKRLQRPGITARRTRYADSQYPVTVKGIPATSVTRTLIDLAAILPRSTLEKALDEAIRRGMTDIGRLRRVLLRSGWRRRGGRVLRALISERDSTGEKTDSELEDRVIRLIRRRRLPPPVVHLNLMDGDDWLGEVDLAYPEERIAIEVHGYSVHSRKRVWENDQRRENELVRAGWRLLKATSSQLDQDPDSFIDALRSLLKSSRASRNPSSYVRAPIARP